jgi:hypothetical protein
LKNTIEDQIDLIVEQHDGRARFFAMDTSLWTTPFEARLPFRLPPSFLALIRRYRFPVFECGDFSLFGNVNGTQHDDLATAVFRDRILAAVTQRNGLVQVGRPDFATLSYDPLCFDLRKRSKSGEAPLVRLDHEELLINSRIRIVNHVSESFWDFFGKLSA